MCVLVVAWVPTTDSTTNSGPHQDVLKKTPIWMWAHLRLLLRQGGGRILVFCFQLPRATRLRAYSIPLQFLAVTPVGFAIRTVVEVCVTLGQQNIGKSFYSEVRHKSLAPSGLREVVKMGVHFYIPPTGDIYLLWYIPLYRSTSLGPLATPTATAIYLVNSAVGQASSECFNTELLLVLLIGKFSIAEGGGVISC